MSEPESAAGQEPANGAAAGLRILIVDDNTASARILQIMISKLGRHELELAHSGRVAIEKAVTFRPHILFLDLLLGDMSGLDVIEAVRERPGLSGSLFVALTGNNSDEDKRRTEAAGFAIHLTKPVSIAAIEEVLAMYQRTSGSE